MHQTSSTKKIYEIVARLLFPGCFFFGLVHGPSNLVLQASVLAELVVGEAEIYFARAPESV